MKNKLITLIVSIFIATPSQAEIISKSIPSVKGIYEYSNDSRTVTFDMGIRFSSIASASIKLTAQRSDGLANVCYTMPFRCTNPRESPKAFYQLSSENFTESGTLAVDTTDLNTTSAVLSETNQLLDGKGTLFFDIAKMEHNGYLTIHPRIGVSDLSIVIDGVVAPDTSAPSRDCREIPAIGTVSSNLDIHLPLMLYQYQDNDANIWIDLEYLGTNLDEKYVWGLKEVGDNSTDTCRETVGTGTILKNTDFFMPSLNFETPEGTQNIWAKLKYVGKNSDERELWQLKGYGSN